MTGSLSLWRPQALQLVGLGLGRGRRGFGSLPAGGPPRETSWGRELTASAWEEEERVDGRWCGRPGTGCGKVEAGTGRGSFG